MALGSVAMWLVVPFGLIYLVAHLVSSSQPGLAAYFGLLVAIPVCMVAIGKGLARLDRLYGRVSGQQQAVRVQLPWHRSMRGERVSTRQRTVLDVVMVISVGIALLIFVVWFFGFAHMTAPTLG